MPSRINALIAVKRWDDAVSMATLAIAGEPQNPRLHGLLALAHVGAGRPAEALKATDVAVRLDPESEWLHRLRARALREMGRHKEALAAALEAARLAPQSPEALQALASELLALKRTSDAESTVAELVRIAPAWAESFNTRGRLLLQQSLGRSLFQKAKLAQAEADFREALRLAPNEPAYVNNLGVAQQRRGKRKEAIEAFRNAATIDPSFSLARNNLMASTRRYLWGGGLALVLSIALRAAWVSSSGGRNALHALIVVGASLAILSPILLVRYALRRRSLHPAVQTYYGSEFRRTWLRRDAQTWFRAVGLVLLLAGFIGALLAQQGALAVLSMILAIVWVYRGATLWRYASRWLGR